MKKIIMDSWAMGNSKNIKRSVAFYAKFGLKPSMRMPFYAEMKIPGEIVIGLHSEGSRKTGRGSRSKEGWGIMLRVRDLKKTVSGLKRKKVRCAPVRKAPGGAMFSAVRDPDGNRLILVQFSK